MYGVGADETGGIYYTGSDTDGDYDPGSGITESLGTTGVLVKLNACEPTVVNTPTCPDEEVLMCPNPASGQVSIRLNGSPYSSSGGMTLKVVDVVGRDVIEKVLTSPNPSLQGGELLRMDVSGWPDGVYVLMLTDGDGNRHTQRLVVQH